jgi:S1-C subfamily serine protease
VDHGLTDQLWRFRAGDRVGLTFLRGTDLHDVEVELGSEPK